MILIIYLQNKEQLFVAFFVFIAPNLDIKKVGSVNGTSVLLHLTHFSSLCDAQRKAQKMGEILSAQRG